MNRQQRKTRKAILNAFSDLLVRKNYSLITVQEIIDRADVGRTTFYAHYPKKEKLLQELCVELFEHVFSRELEAELTHDFSMARGDIRGVFAHLLYHLQDQGKRVILLLTSESGELFQQYFRQHFNVLLESHILKKNELKKNTVPVDFLVDHISGSFINMVRWWQKNDMKQAPEEMAGYFVEVIQPIL